MIKHLLKASLTKATNIIIEARVFGDCTQDGLSWVLKHLLKANLAHMILKIRVFGDCIHDEPVWVLKHLLKANLAHMIIEARVTGDMKTYTFIRRE